MAKPKQANDEQDVTFEEGTRPLFTVEDSVEPLKEIAKPNSVDQYPNGITIENF